MTPVADSVIHTAFWFGIISASSLPLGALTTLVWKPNDRAISFLMSFGGGALLAALTIDLVAGTLAKGHFYPLASGCMIGGLIFIGLNEILNDFGGFLRKASTRLIHLQKQEYKKFREVLSILKRVDVFKNLSSTEFKALSTSIKNIEVKKGADIFTRGDPSDYLYIIASGEVELIDPLEQFSTLTLTENCDIGWLPFITGTPTRFTARATKNCSLWALPKPAFQNLLSKSPVLQQEIHRWLRNPKAISYLHLHHGISEAAAKTWSDSAVQQLLKHGVLNEAMPTDHRSEEFQVIVNQIRRLDLFNSLPRDELEAISARLIYKTFSTDFALFYRDEAAERLYIIEHGEISMLDAIDRTGLAKQIKARDTLGFMAFLTGGRHTTSAMTIKESGIWILRRSDFDELIKKLPELAKHYRLFLQREEIRIYLEKRQKLSRNNADFWISKAIRDMNAGKTIYPVAKLNIKYHEHQGAPLGIFLGLLLDGIPEALVIGASLSKFGLGYSLLAGLFLANYPEALSSSVGMKQQGFKYGLIIMMWTSLMLLTGLLSALGSIYFAEVSHSVFAFTEGLAAGAMLTMIAQTMLPEAYLKGGEIVGFSTLLGFLCAIFFKTLE